MEYIFTLYNRHCPKSIDCICIKILTIKIISKTKLCIIQVFKNKNLID